MSFPAKNIFFFLALSMFSLAVGAQEEYGIFYNLQSYSPNGAKVNIYQSEGITKLFNAYYLENASNPGMQGYRIRLYFDLGQSARSESGEVMMEFMENHPGIAVYRSFDSPYYKVSVGDFRTRDEALKLHKSLQGKYPKAFIVPEWINFPPLE